MTDPTRGAQPPIDRLRAIMARLRTPEIGCPWDLAQNFATIAPYTIEEAYEVADAIERANPTALKDELGDLLFQVVFHARMAEELGQFDFDDVASAIADKMIRRHPHVFADQTGITSAADQTTNWERQKAAERQAQGAVSALDGVTPALPALTRAAKIQARAARVGFDWPAAAPILEKITEETRELAAEMAVAMSATGSTARIEEELGDLLFAVTNLARHLAQDPEAALRRATLKFERRFRRMEALAGGAIAGLDAAAWEGLWERVKAEE